MEKLATILTALFIFAVPTNVSAQSEPSDEKNSLLGTWKLVSTKYGNAPQFSAYPKQRQRIKLITSTHFMWSDHVTDTKKTAASAGGSYTFKNGSYSEVIEFASEGMERYLNNEQTFTLKIEGDKLLLSGQLSDDLKIEEIWHRASKK